MTTDVAAALELPVLQPALFVTMTFRTGPINVWTGYGSIPWGGHTWQGIGDLGGFAVIEEASSVEAKGTTLTLSGVDPANLAAVMTEFQLGGATAIYLGLFAGGFLIGDPIPVWAGVTDQATVDAPAETATIAVNCESQLLDMDNAPNRRYSNDDQQLDYPGDQGMQFVNAIQEVTIYWGQTPLSANNR
jgi:hypothetical protein